MAGNHRCLTVIAMSSGVHFWKASMKPRCKFTLRFRNLSETLLVSDIQCNVLGSALLNSANEV